MRVSGGAEPGFYERHGWLAIGFVVLRFVAKDFAGARPELDVWFRGEWWLAMVDIEVAVKPGDGRGWRRSAQDGAPDGRSMNGLAGPRSNDQVRSARAGDARASHHAVSSCHGDPDRASRTHAQRE